MLKLPNVTLVMVETRCHQLAKMAIEDCLSKVEFGEVLTFSDKSLSVPGAVEIPVEDWSSKLGWSECLWYDVPNYIKTDQALLIQWDSWIFNPDCWRDEFATFDHIGSPWWYEDGLNVGNTGFSLRSRKLMQHLVTYRDKYPVSDPEDVALSRQYRRQLEADGFVYAPQETALDFSFECVRRTPDSQHFGFHALKNWYYVLDDARLVERLKIANKNEYIRRTDMLHQLGVQPFYVGGYKKDGNWLLVKEL